MPVPTERITGWISPKWLVSGAVLAADGLLLNYDLRLGLAGAALIAAVVVLWVYFAFRLGAFSSEPAVRSSLAAHVIRSSASRRKLATLSGPQQGPEPAESA